MALVSCADSASSVPEEASSAEETATSVSVTTTTVTETKKTVTTTAPRVKHPKLLTVDVISYDGEQLTYQFEGGEHTVLLTPEKFSDYDPTSVGVQYSQKIINNRFGIAVKADIRLNDEGTEATWCDVFDKNVYDIDIYSLYTLGGGKGTAPLKESICSLKRIEGSRYELKNPYYSLTVDLNDLPNDQKQDLGDEYENITFNARMFEDGSVIITNIMDVTEATEAGIASKGIDTRDKYRFFGTVQTVTDDRASVLLTDGKTLCDVPTYFNDGEVTEGAEVMIVLDAEPSLFGSGERYTAEYAVFYTDPLSVLPKKQKDISLLAYAVKDPGDVKKYICTTIEEAEESAYTES